MDVPDRSTGKGALWTALRWVVLGAFACTAAVIALLVGRAVLSAFGSVFDPHGYGMFAGILFSVVLTPVAVALWALYRSLRRRGR
ncbi:hypothetical protein GCM10022243_42370 [Saccharothrix violaceirubra]|uniref:Uncharacterized protein n=1 Tax=Saccharothrix violaceirubra TaxID=413306 RepID=A0A7W7WVP1_9PSEU|nr:hypothetical protein [Saccharothrix violaceirubra]MBB4965525.1 hypothetical protein [Saccharothrix violaceirubra]